MGMDELGITILPVGSPLEQRLEKSGNYTARRDDLIQMAAGRSVWVLGMWAFHRVGVQHNIRADNKRSRSHTSHLKGHTINCLFKLAALWEQGHAWMQGGIVGAHRGSCYLTASGGQ